MQCTHCACGTFGDDHVHDEDVRTPCEIHEPFVIPVLITRKHDVRFPDPNPVCDRRNDAVRDARRSDSNIVFLIRVDSGRATRLMIDAYRIEPGESTASIEIPG